MLVTVTLNMVYTLEIGVDRTPTKAIMLCPKCNAELECLGFGEYAILKLRLILSRTVQVDSS